MGLMHVFEKPSAEFTQLLYTPAQLSTEKSSIVLRVSPTFYDVGQELSILDTSCLLIYVF